MQEFITSVVERVKPPGVEGDKAKTVARLRAVFQTLEHTVGEADREVLNALVAYWRSLSDLTMRQEHGALKEGAALTWNDSRRVVFQVAVVMFEVDSTVRRVLR